MLEYILILLSLILLPDGSNTYLQNADAAKILRNSEMKRGPWYRFEMNASLENTENEKSSKKSSYKVYFKDEVNTLVGILEPKFERGNLLLMVKEDLWFYVKDTRRPTRITPIQKLSGSVSYGDLARLNWSLDYVIDNMEETSLESGKKSYLLFLTAKSKAATYHKIKLWIDKGNLRPIKSEVFLLSGKHFKTIEYLKFEQLQGKEMNTEILYTDHLNNNMQSILRFSEVSPRDNIPDRYFIKTALPNITYELIK